MKKNKMKEIILALFIVIMLSSCGVTKNSNTSYVSIDCENCDEID